MQANKSLDDVNKLYMYVYRHTCIYYFIAKLLHRRFIYLS